MLIIGQGVGLGSLHRGEGALDLAAEKLKNSIFFLGLEIPYIILFSQGRVVANQSNTMTNKLTTNTKIP